jgi:hypothetical protein
MVTPAMARLQIYSDDLLFGSNLQAQLLAAGHEVGLGLGVEPGCDAVVADLTIDASGRVETLAGVELPVLAFYSHVDVAIRDEALAAGFAIVVPRSRIAREAPVLVEQLLATAR